MTYMDRWSYQISRTEYIKHEPVFMAEIYKNNIPPNETYAYHSGLRNSKSIFKKTVRGKQKRKLLFS